MGKKRKIISKPQKFGRKHSSHPAASTGEKKVAVEEKPKLQKTEVKVEEKPQTLEAPKIEKVEPPAAPASPETAELPAATPTRRRRRTATRTRTTKPTDD